jgi:hypothetical protein
MAVRVPADTGSQDSTGQSGFPEYQKTVRVLKETVTVLKEAVSGSCAGLSLLEIASYLG